MSAALLYDSIARIARHESSARAIAAIGRVTNVYPGSGAVKDHAVTVRLRESGLALPRVPIAVGALGFAAIPDVDDLVIVLFADGDLHSPVVVGRLYRSDFEPPPHKEGQLVLHLPPGTADPKLTCDIAGDPASIKLTLPDGVAIEITKGRIRCEADSASLTLDSGGKIEAKVGDASLTLKKSGDVRVKCSKFKVEADDVQIKSSGKVAIKGSMLELN